MTIKTSIDLDCFQAFNQCRRFAAARGCRVGTARDLIWSNELAPASSVPTKMPTRRKLVKTDLPLHGHSDETYLK